MSVQVLDIPRLMPWVHQDNRAGTASGAASSSDTRQDRRHGQQKAKTIPLTRDESSGAQAM